MKAPRICYLDPGRDYVRVKKGFSWPAFFFGPFWAAAKKNWGLFFLMMLVEILLYALGAAVHAQRDLGLAGLQFLLAIAYWVGRGLVGNPWWRASLRRRGYQRVIEKPASA